ncbi:glycosyltransferase family 2 protein [Cellulomonas taurus]|uniref:glycosyltransferase family 2 protein n=1 Tax=Cellulomonas taurus TaxID=2729175 RepID=UPI00145E3758|nr:glycosyltransferase family 2 protein [Cellulomonas taurus]
MTRDPDAQRLLVIVPAWNEREALPGVLAELAASMPEADVLVVNDGSTDGTADVARATGLAKVLDLPLNLGVGGAMRAGYRFAAREGYDAAVQVDADGQHDPADVRRVVAALSDEVDVAIGARFAGVGNYTVRGPRKWAMGVLSGVLSRIAGTKLTDTTSGFRASNRRAILLFADEYPAEYLGDTVESLVIACRAGLTVRQVGVEMRPRAGGTPSHNPAKAAIFLGRAMIALVIALSRPMGQVPAGVHR